jgi:hypothetical protein
MQKALEDGRGWSMIRISDGECGLFESVRRGRPVRYVNHEGWLNKFLPTRNWKEVGEALLKAIPVADFIGLPRFNAMTSNPSYALYRELPLHGIDLHTLRLTDSWANHAIRYKEGVIKSLCNKYNIGVLYHDINHAKALFEDRYKAKDFVAFQYNKTINDDQILDEVLKSGRQLVFLSGGPRGKILNTRMAQNGLVTYDFGQSIEVSYDWLKNLYENRARWTQ